jgi:hypothetical protein
MGTDKQIDRPTDEVSYRGACSQVKIEFQRFWLSIRPWYLVNWKLQMTNKTRSYNAIKLQRYNSTRL